MNAFSDNLDEALRAAEAGRLDALTPEQVARLEAILNEEAAVAARLADCTPAPDDRLAAALDGAAAPHMPSAAAWNEAWGHIEAAAPALAGRGAGVTGRILRLWKPLAAVAACLIFALVWSFSGAAGAAQWPLRLAHSAEISELEVPDGTTLGVFSIGDDDADVIWVVEDAG